MSNVALGILRDHSAWLVLLALMICMAGSAVTVQLFGRIKASSGISRSGWIVLCAVATGTMVWCTHFVAMMAFHTTAPVSLDPLLTFCSLLIAIALSVPGLARAAREKSLIRALGGAEIGVAIAAMHYTGMAAYHVSTMVMWNWYYVATSVLLAVGLSGSAFLVMNGDTRRDQLSSGMLLALAVVTLHFTGMSAMHVEPSSMAEAAAEPGLSITTMTTMAIATSCAAILVIGCAAVCVIIDGHTQSETYRRLHRMAMCDALTGLPNRSGFNADLDLRLRTRQGRTRLAVIMLDLSRFKHINDTYGHRAGDEVLVALAGRVSALQAPGASFARLGGDEFAAILTYDQEAKLAGFLGRLEAVFADPFDCEQFSTVIGCNIGIAVCPNDGVDADTLLAKADLAMYRAKSAFSTEPCFYRAEMDEAVRDRRDLTNDLRLAIADGAFEVHYQVQASIETGKISGYEALIRWHHPTRGAVPPSVFVPLAEEIGEIIPLGNWVLRRACAEAAAWPASHVVSVNLSPLQLSDPDLVAIVSRALEESGLAPGRLALELTESALIRDRAFALRQLHMLKAMGISLALDDFGVGYSSLDVLRAFPFDRIKLDASFIAEIDKSEQAILILRSVTALGASLNIPVLAEGVEELEQLRIVEQEGCQAVQGFLIGRPERSLADPERVRQALDAVTLDRIFT